MKRFHMVFLTVMACAGTGYDACALTIDTVSGVNADGSAKFGDPDDRIPFPHAADDGTMPSPSGYFKGQALGDGGMRSGLTPPDDGRDAFRRAQENRD